MKQHIYFLVLTAFFATACKVDVNKSKIQRGNDIPVQLQSEIHYLDDRVIEAITTGDASLITEIISPLLQGQDGNNLDSIFNLVSSLLKNPSVKRYDEVYAINRAVNIPNSIVFNKGKENEFTINYQAPDLEMFISLFTIKSVQNDLMVTMVYGKGSLGWKLHYLQFGTYAMYGKTALDYYKDAKKFESRGFYVDASNSLSFMLKTIRPGNQLWKYQQEEEIAAYHKKLVETINAEYKLPLVVDQLPTKPQIYQISPRIFNEKYLTQIRYYSSINITDTVALKRENMALRSVLGTIFAGIDDDKDFLLYTVTNQMPSNEIVEVNAYSFVQEFNKPE